MLFNSYEFILVYLPLTLAGWHWAAALGGDEARCRWLLVASLVFYGFGGPWLVGMLAGSMVFNFVVGRMLGRETVGAGWRRGWMWGGVVANLALLGGFKYAGFFVANAGALLGTGWKLAPIALPLGISFYTFLQIGYLVDAYRGRTARYRFLDYALFVTFFPHLIAGPIVHHSDLIPQFRAPGRRLGAMAGLAEGLALFTVGLAKKVLIADRLSGPASRVFGAVGAGADVTCGDAWLGLLSYAFQIYFDFSGYSEMAVGLGRMFGVRLPFNFDSPYAAVSLADFWRRWHITLSNFIRDYLYIPLGGSRRGRGRTCLNLVIVMTLAGLWHGANWTFVLWGAAHGLVLAAGQLRRDESAPASRMRTRLGSLATFAFVTLAWVLFRSDSLTTAGRYFAELAGLGSGTGAVSMIKSRYWIQVGLLYLAVRLLPNARQWMDGPEARVAGTATATTTAEATAGTRGVVGRGWAWIRGGGSAEVRAAVAGGGVWGWRPTRAWAWGLGGLLAACLLSLSEVSEFLYWQF